MIHDSKNKFGGYFEDFVIGDVFKHWPGKTVTEMDNHLFSLLTMNHNPLHIDENYMTLHQHKKILVVGTLVFSLIVGMSVRDISGKAIANLEYENILHLKPVFQGDTLYSTSTILDVVSSKTKDDRGIVYLETIGENQVGNKVISLRRRFLVPKE